MELHKTNEMMIPTDNTLRCICGGLLQQLAMITDDYREYVCKECKQTYEQRKRFPIGDVD